MEPLYLTKTEQDLFAKLPQELKEGWKVEVENGTAYESDAVIAMRRRMASFEEFPHVQVLVDRVQKGEQLESLTLKDVPETVLPELCFTIGARGLSVLMGALLKEVKSDEDIEGLSGLSVLRHEMLLSNAPVPSR
jgi:hypothetical protein